MRPRGGELHRLQVDIPPELNAKLDQLKPEEQERVQIDLPRGLNRWLGQIKIINGVPKKMAIRVALEELKRNGGNGLL